MNSFFDWPEAYKCSLGYLPAVWVPCGPARVAESVDAADLKSASFGSVSSNLTPGTQRSIEGVFRPRQHGEVLDVLRPPGC